MGIIVDIVIWLLGEILGEEWRDRHMRKHQRSGRVDCGLRVIDGTHEGLKKGWRVRRAVVHEGRLDFGRRTPTPVQVSAVVTDRRHQAGLGLQLDSSFQIVELRTESATLEWAVPEDKLDWAIARLQGAESPSEQPV